MFFVVRTGLSENKVLENPVRYHHFPHLNRNFWGCNQPPGPPIASCSPELSTARNLAGKCVHCQVRIMAMGENMFSNPGSSELGLELWNVMNVHPPIQMVYGWPENPIPSTLVNVHCHDENYCKLAIPLDVAPSPYIPISHLAIASSQCTLCTMQRYRIEITLGVSK